MKVELNTHKKRVFRNGGIAVGGIVILTNNIENELVLYDQLKRLNYEVFITQELFIYWLERQVIPFWIEAFPIVIISETIALQDAEKLCFNLKQKNAFCLLKIDQQLSVEEKETYFSQGFDQCFTNEVTLSELREVLFCFRTSDSFVQKNTHVKNSSINFRIKLTPLDNRIVSILLENLEEAIPREQLSTELWGRCTNSTLSHLYTRVKKINQTIKETEGVDGAIITLRGRGYRFRDYFYER
ncbi:helix-turn-helix domain-containing protein [Enterococcus gilvus]|uniref:winged helix-turn-helix domain-containing protein n=1 Tax=Enterococcus gilvus TaxID=160453 RepID=UPI0028D803AC|nr:helix-turn-helix domain-containing protein [Enterococcus gilvus]